LLLTLGVLVASAALTYAGGRLGIPRFAIFAAVGVAMVVSYAFYRKAKAPESPYKGWRSAFMYMFFGTAWLLFINGLYLVAGNPEREPIEIEVLAPYTTIFGHSFSTAVVWTWVVMAMLTALALAFRFLVYPHFTEIPSGLQNAMETVVEWIENYATDKSDHDYGLNLGAYTFSIAAMLIGMASLEFFKVRAPTADVTVTGGFAVCSFGLFNYYSFKRLGLIGKLKWYVSPTPMMLPIKIVIDFAKPVSLACRLYGNMLGGFIIMDLFYLALNYSSAGLQGLLGLFFNIFHPLVQVLIFITLSLTYIAEATE